MAFVASGTLPRMTRVTMVNDASTPEAIPVESSPTIAARADHTDIGGRACVAVVAHVAYCWHDDAFERLSSWWRRTGPSS